MANRGKLIAGIFILIVLNQNILAQDTCDPCTKAVIPYCCNINNLCCGFEESTALSICASLSNSKPGEACKKSEHRCKKQSDCPQSNQDCCPTHQCGSVCVVTHE